MTGQRLSDIGPVAVPAVDPVDAPDGPPRREDHPQDDHDPEQDEGVGPAGQVFQVAARQRARHGRRLQAVVRGAALPHTPAPPEPRAPAGRDRAAAAAASGRGRTGQQHARYTYYMDAGLECQSG